MPTKNWWDNFLLFLNRYWAALLWAALILFLIGLPGEDLPNVDFWEIDIEDKIGHLIVFAILSGLIMYGHRKRWPGRKLGWKVILFTVFIGVTFGALTEFLQHLIFVSRFASLSDFIADALGAILGTVFASKWLITKAH